MTGVQTCALPISVEVFDERTAKNGYKKIIEELHLNERKPKRFVFSNSIYKPIVKRKNNQC